MPNSKKRGVSIVCHSGFVIDSSFVIRHSSFLDVEILAVSSANRKNKTHVPHRCEPV